MSGEGKDEPQPKPPSIAQLFERWLREKADEPPRVLPRPSEPSRRLIADEYARLQRYVATIAWDVAPGKSQLHVDLRADAMSILWVKATRECGYRPGKPGTGSWMKTVLKNELTDRRLREKTQTQHLERGTDIELAPTVQGRADPISSEELALADLEWDKPLPECDMQVILQWTERDRLMLLSMCGLWRRVPRETWDRWVRDYGALTPFPSWAFEQADDKHERHEALRTGLRMEQSPFNTDWNRKYEWLGTLKAIQDRWDDLTGS